jgi:zinc/manganese transport system substrate-binding protein
MTTRRHLLCALGVAALPWPAVAAKPLQVVASFSILADMAREVAGPAAEVSALVGPNGDAHVFEPKPADAQRLARADLVIVSGLGFEGWIERLIRASGFRGPLVVASRGITPRAQGRGHDPHVWQSLAHARTMVANLRDALVAAAPAQTAALEQRARDYDAALEALDREARNRLAALPAGRRRVITSHDAFGYLGAAYGITFIAPRGWSTDTEPSAAQVAGVIRQIRAEQASALFVENISDARLVERIARETGAVVGGTLYSDALSPPGGEADTYLRLYAHNVRTIAGAIAKASLAENRP